MIRFRASSISRLMTEPKTKSEGPLSVGAKTLVREIAAQDIFGVDFEVSDKKLEKGQRVEPQSLALINRVLGRSLQKNTERRGDDYFTGECDLFDQAEVVDMKSAWSLATFPLVSSDIADAQRKAYEFQGRVYMRLWNRPRFRIAYCIVDTPDDLIGYEPLQLHVVGHIPEHMRLTQWVIDRDLDIEAAMVEKVKHARAYYAEVVAEFERTHCLPGDPFDAPSAIAGQPVATPDDPRPAAPTPQPKPVPVAVGLLPDMLPF